MLNNKKLLIKVLTSLARPFGEDVSNAITFNSGWTGIIKKAYRFGSIVFYQLEATATYIAHHDYVLANIASGYRPEAFYFGAGYTTDSAYNPKALASVRTNTNGNINVVMADEYGAYIFAFGFYKMGGGN